jgi:hypothetical protein
MVSGIVPISFFDQDIDIDADGVYNVFVPAIKSGEVSTEQFKMQLRKEFLKIEWKQKALTQTLGITHCWNRQ